MARPHAALIELAARRPLGPVSDYDELARSATEHRMGGLLFSALSDEAPSDLRKDLAKATLRVRAWHQTLWNETREVTRLLGAEGISVGTFKGVTSEARWYEAAGERPCADADLFVDPGQIDRIGDLVRLLQPDHLLAPDIQKVIDRKILHSVDIRLPSGAWLDVHVDPLKIGVRSSQLDTIWELGEMFDLGDGILVRVLSPEIALVQFLLHAQKDRFSFLLALADVARVLADTPINWEFVERFARKDDLAVHVYESLRAVDGFLDLALDADLTAPWPSAGWKRKAWHLLWPDQSLVQGDHGFTRRVRRWYWIPFSMRGRFREALSWWLRLLFPPREIVSYSRARADTSGPYLWRLIDYRLSVVRERHARNREQRRSKRE